MAFAQTARPIPGAVATAGVNERLTFIRKTYAHLAAAIGLFVVLEYFLLQSQLGLDWVIWAYSGNWLFVLVLFMGAAWIADKWAHSATSRTMQYIGLGLYIIAEVFIFAPLLFIAANYANDPYLIHKAGVITLMLFGGLTATVFMTKKDFSFLGPILSVATLAAVGIIVVSFLWGFALGTLFAAAMVVLAAGFILYNTSQVLAHYRPTQYVAASLSLFAAIALMFYYIVFLFMGND